MDTFISFFKRLGTKEEKEKPVLYDPNLKVAQQSALGSEDKSLVEKIRASHEKYINLETGRGLILTSASKKKYIDHRWKFCGDNSDQFYRIQQELTKPSHEELGKKENPPAKKIIVKQRRNTIESHSMSKKTGTKFNPGRGSSAPQERKSMLPSGEKKNGAMPAQERKRKNIPKNKRHLIWMRDYGNVAEALCCCCGLVIVTESTSEAGHIRAFADGGSDEIENLRMICRTCNADMGTQDMNEFMRINGYPIKKK